MPQWRKIWTKTPLSFDIQDMPDDFTRLLWVLLPLALGNDGTMSANPALVRSRVFPLRHDVTEQKIEQALAWYHNRGLIRLYVAESGREYLFVKGFAKEQGSEGRSPWAVNKWRVAVFTRDDYTCQECGARGVRLNAHHVRPWYLSPEDRYDLNNGITLCRKCHKRAHVKGWKREAEKHA